MKTVATVSMPELFARYEQNLNDSYTWQIAVIGGFMSIIAFIALMSLVLNK